MNQPCDNPALQELRELGYDRVADEIAEGLNRWDDKLAGERRGLVESYLKGNAGLHVHVAIRVPDDWRVSERYCVYLELKVLGGDNVIKTANIHSTLWNLELDSFLPESGGRCDTDGKGAVFVNSVQFVNLPKGMRVEQAPAVMRLKRLDDRASCQRDTADFSGLGLGIHRPGMNDGKLGAPDLAVGHARGVHQGEGKCQVIQRRAASCKWR